MLLRICYGVTSEFQYLEHCMDRLDELTIFVAIIDAGSLAGAARRLRRSRPAVTRALAGLEARVGARLIARTTRQFTPTEAGRSLAATARRLLSDYEASIQDVATAPIRGLLRITAPLAFGRRHVTPVVTEYLALYPETQVELMLADRNLDLIEEGLDLAVRIGPLPDSQFTLRRVGEVGRIVVAAPVYLARRGTPQRPADIAGHDTIASVAAGQTLTWRFGGAGRGVRVQVTPRLIVNEVEAALVAARAGQGLARLLSYQAADDLASGTLVRLLRPYEPPPLPVQLLVPGGRHPAPKVRAFMDLAADRLSRLVTISGEG
jgi:DNA-binding transcriptional LysR family regulator